MINSYQPIIVFCRAIQTQGLNLSFACDELTETIEIYSKSAHFLSSGDSKAEDYYYEKGKASALFYFLIQTEWVCSSWFCFTLRFHESG
jgi:hypothetical protein